MTKSVARENSVGRLRHGRRSLVVGCALACALMGSAWVPLMAQEAGSAPHAELAEAAGEHGAAAEHGESTGAFISRILNFVILAGGLYYLLRSPLVSYLEGRREQIRADHDFAEKTRVEAQARMRDIEQKMSLLPGEIEALKTRGKTEVAAEGVRIREAAEAERQRLMEQTRREIDRQLHIARRELTEYAADLAVGVARAKLSQQLTPAAQLRLVDQYAAQIGGAS